MFSEMNKLERICEAYPDAEFVKADGLDDAVIGVDEETMRLIYSKEKCVEVLEERDGMSWDEAYEFLSFNTWCAGSGPKTPIWCDDMTLQ